MTDYPKGPWQTDVDVAGVSDLNGVWQTWTTPERIAQAIQWYSDAYGTDWSEADIRSFLGYSLNDRKKALESAVDQQPSGDSTRKQSTAERVDAAIIQHFAATEAYAVAVEEAATLDADAKRLGARKFLAVKANVPEGAKRVTDSEANRAVDADEEVLTARLAAEISAAHAKAAKARLDHWEHVIEWGRSVYSRETRADTR